MERDWEDIRRENPVNERRVQTYRRLMEACERISETRNRRGTSWTAIEEALVRSELTDAEVNDEPDLYLTTLTRFVTALGGHVEVHAIFPEETLAMRNEPDA
jgi:adenosyl cobinamide kinase/adenosyl cobinamide phosphate guanylyltransferase